ncbi:MAG: hypothetical protein LBQ50_10785 [Planctomycetaceae bacterium]|jgi:hypothetical protein|nr:hypothetical protein [Planctomycetaceae bacterium]
MKYPYLFFVLFLLLMPFCVGCNKKVGVHGKVSFSDGKPLDLGIVCFQGDKFVYRGMIQLDGTFQMMTQKQADGVEPGTYKVFITGATRGKPLLPNVKFNSDAAPPDDEPPIPLIDERFTSPATSEITCTVTKGMTLPFEIKVEYPQK